MSKTYLLGLGFITCLLLPLGAAEPLILSEINKPQQIVVEGEHIYITEVTSIYIYSSKTFKLLKKFGRGGEGPRELKPRPGLTELLLRVQPGSLLVVNNHRLSYFSRTGTFIEELNTTQAQVEPVPFGEGFIGRQRIITDDKTMFHMINIYDAKLNLVKEVFREKNYFQPNKRVNIIYLAYQRLPRFFAAGAGNKIVVEGRVEDCVHVFDKEGVETATIKADLGKLKLTSAHKKATEDYFEFIQSIVYRRLGKFLYYPDHFPSYRDMAVADGKIYLIPYKKHRGKSNVHVYTLEGKLLKKRLIPLPEQNLFWLYPFTVHRGRVYQLVENEEEEAWELVIHGI